MSDSLPPREPGTGSCPAAPISAKYEFQYELASSASLPILSLSNQSGA